MTAPCGVPCFVSDHWPSSDTPALSHFWIRRSILRSATRCSMNFRLHLWLMLSLVHRYYGAVRLLRHVHVRSSVYGLRGPVLLAWPRRAGDLPVLVHVVSQRARVLRLRRTEQPLALTRLPCCLPPSRKGVSIDPSAFRSSIARPTGTSIYASGDTSRCLLQDSRPGWIRCSPFL